MQWASVVEEILDLLDISECSVMAHSAGTPYALSFANKLPERIRGNICLLAPWVGGSENGTISLHFVLFVRSEPTEY
jgi:pimeloyl-ACP methyl ester carboxylesterase